MSTSRARFPVTVTYLPVTRCQVLPSHHPLPPRQVLTEHYRQAHPPAAEHPVPVAARRAASFAYERPPGGGGRTWARTLAEPPFCTPSWPSRLAFLVCPNWQFC